MNTDGSNHDSQVYQYVTSQSDSGYLRASETSPRSESGNQPYLRRFSTPAGGAGPTEEDDPQLANLKASIKNARSRSELITIFRTQAHATPSSIDLWVRRVPQITKGKPLWQDRELMGCFEEAVHSLTTSPDCEMYHLTGLFWAAAKTSYSGVTELKPRVEARILEKGSDLDPIDVCLCLWAFSQKATGRPSNAVLHQLVNAIKRRGPEFEAMGVATCMWSLAKLNAVDLFREAEEALRPALVRLAEAKAFEAQNVSNMLWSYASTAIRPVSPALAAMMSALLHLASKSLFEGQAIANSLWALAKLGLTVEFKTAEAALRNKLLRPASEQVLKPQELSNVLWSFGALRLRPDRTVLKALIDVVVMKSKQFNQNDTAFLLGALARLGLVAEFCEVEASLRPVLLSECRVELAIGLQPHSAANILQAFGELGVEPEPELMNALSIACMKRINEFRPQDLAQVLLAFAELGLCPPAQTLLGLIQALVSNVKQCNQRHTANSAWALAIIARCTAPHVLSSSAWLQVVVDALSKRLADLGTSTFSDEELSQLFQAYLLLRNVPGCGLRLPDQLVGRAESAWRQQVDANCRISELQLDVSRSLKALGIEPELKLCTDDGLFRVQLAVKESRLAFEVCGPYRFTINTRRLSGPTLARKILLEERGWTVVHVYYFQWDELRTDLDKIHFLSSLLTASVHGKGPYAPVPMAMAPVPYDHMNAFGLMPAAHGPPGSRPASMPGSMPGSMPENAAYAPAYHTVPMASQYNIAYGVPGVPIYAMAPPSQQDLINQLSAMNMGGVPQAVYRPVAGGMPPSESTPYIYG